jgi:hypothetical protein
MAIITIYTIRKDYLPLNIRKMNAPIFALRIIPNSRKSIPRKKIPTPPPTLACDASQKNVRHAAKPIK